MQINHKSILMILFLSALSCAQEPDKSRWIDRNAEGYFWYQDTPEEVEAEPLLERPSPPPSTTPPQSTQFSTAWIRENLPKYMDQAIDNPTDDNITAYLLLQKRAIDKSFVFTDAVQMVAQSNPQLDPNNERPTATFASKSLDALTSVARKKLIQQISQETALIYFMDESDLTRIQNPIVEVIERTLDFATARIAIEPLSESTSRGKKIKDNNGRNIVMNIQNYPAIVLIRADGVFDIISQAPVSLDDFIQRTFMSAKRLNVITEEEFNSTRPLRNIATKSTIDSVVLGEKDVPAPSQQIIKELSGKTKYAK